MTVGLYNLPSRQGWFWHLPIHLLLLDSQFFPNSASWGDRIHCYIILAIQFRPTVWWVFDVPLTWDPSDAQTKCQHCPLHPIISDNYARLIPSMFVRFPHQKLATNQWHFLTSTTLLFWDRTQAFLKSSVCWAVRLSTNKTCFSRFSSTGFNVVFQRNISTLLLLLLTLLLLLLLLLLF